METRVTPKPNTSASLSAIHALVERDFGQVNDRIRAQLHSEVPLINEIGGYIIDGGGKRLRPLVVLLTAGACGYRGNQHIALAAVVEFLHTATLLHDDVVDMSDLRRGRATANANWGNAPSVLVGDFIYSRAFQLMVEIGDLPVMRVLASTTNTLAEGEILQLVNTGRIDLTEADYLRVIQHKTAQLFSAAAESAALLANCQETEVGTLRRYGNHLGMAFQLIDDLLDYDGDTHTLGKNLGDDLAEGKPTLPLIHCMAQSSEPDAKTVATALRDRSSERLDEVVDIVRRSGALDYTRTQAYQQLQNALECAAQLRPSPYRDGLAQIARFAVERDS